MKDLNWYQSQFDEMFLEIIRMTHKNKDIPQAINESYLHLMSDEVRLSMADQSDCKRLLNTWLSNSKVKSNGKSGVAKIVDQQQKLNELIDAKYGSKTN